MLIFSSYTEPGLCSVTVSKCTIGGCIKRTALTLHEESSPTLVYFSPFHQSHLVPCANLSSLTRLVLLRIIPVSVLNPVDGRNLVQIFPDGHKNRILILFGLL